MQIDDTNPEATPQIDNAHVAIDATPVTQTAHEAIAANVSDVANLSPQGYVQAYAPNSGEADREITINHGVPDLGEQPVHDLGATGLSDEGNKEAALKGLEDARESIQAIIDALPHAPGNAHVGGAKSELNFALGRLANAHKEIGAN